MSAQPSVPPSQGNRALTLGNWNFYFLAKFLLYWKGAIGFHAIENFAFAAFLLVPVESRGWRRARQMAALPLAVSLLYYDSWLPAAGRLWSQVGLVSQFSAAYLAELAGRFVNWPLVASLVLLWAAYRLVAYRVRVGVLVLSSLALLTLIEERGGRVEPAGVAAGAQAATEPGREGGDGEDPEALLQAFYATEAGRSVTFPTPAAGAPPFDILFIHVCSLSWDDLRAVGLDAHPLWQRFDLLFTRFNSATSYSGPAAIRIQRATCGQPSHRAVFGETPDRCYLMGALQQSGFEPEMLLNHDGHFDDFLNLVRVQGRLGVAPLSIDGLPVVQRAFDNSPVYDDLAVLSRWLDARGGKASPRVAAYYNTVTLHDGNRWVAGGEEGPLAGYKARLARLLDGIERFIGKVESSGRRVLLVVVPEHGAAIRGDAMQIAGLREIPTPAITLVPVGVKVIGPDALRRGGTVRIESPASFLALSEIAARMIGKPPFGPLPFEPAEYARELPVTGFVAENDGVVLMEHGGRYYFRQGNDGWIDYTGRAPAGGEASH